MRERSVSQESKVEGGGGGEGGGEKSFKRSVSFEKWKSTNNPSLEICRNWEV